MKENLRNILKRILDKLVYFVYGDKSDIYKIIFEHSKINLDVLKDYNVYSKISKKAKLYSTYQIFNSQVDDYTYIAQNSIIKNTKIGKFCSIGPNLVCGWGIHPTNGISTSPMFYSTHKQNGFTLSKTEKILEQLPIDIGNDVFIGMNVTILDGVSIGDGAIIGAGSVVSKDIPPYAIAVGSPIKIIKYRFEEKHKEQLLEMKWWDYPENDLQKVEKYFFDVEAFINQSINKSG